MNKEQVVTGDVKKYLETHPNWETLMDRFIESPMTSQLEDMHDHERAEMMAELLGLPLLGNGSNRFVVEFNGFAVKLPLWSMGIQENRQENQLWNEFGENVQKHFLPCLGFDTWFSLFPMIEPLEYDQWQELKKAFETEYESMVRKLKKDGIQLYDVGFYEERYDQWALHKDRLVIIDYGDCYLE